MTPLAQIIYTSFLGCCVWAAVCITWRTTSPLRLGAVLLLHIQAMAEQYTVEIMTYHLICEGSKSEIYAPKNGNRFNITTSSFINGEEGVNEHGLAVAMTFVMTDLEKIKAGFNSCFIVRYLLEKADNTEQAVSLLMGLPVSSNCNILLADKKGNMVVVECTPILKKVRAAETFENGSIVCTVNSFTSDEMKPYDDAKGNDYDSHRRYRTVLDSFSSERIKDEYIETTEHLLKGDYGFMCQYDDEPNFETVWSSIFDLDSLVIYRAEGDPRKKKFVTDNRLHDLIRRG